MNVSLPCAVCSKPIEAVDKDHPEQPYGANIFISYGHYGATAYDSPGGENLEIFICTDCMKGMVERNSINRVLHATAHSPEQKNLWMSENDPEDDNAKNKLRLKNEYALEEFLEYTPEMSMAWANALYEDCHKASQSGVIFNPKLTHPV